MGRTGHPISGVPTPSLDDPLGTARVPGKKKGEGRVVVHGVSSPFSLGVGGGRKKREGRSGPYRLCPSPWCQKEERGDRL